MHSLSDLTILRPLAEGEKNLEPRKWVRLAESQREQADKVQKTRVQYIVDLPSLINITQN